MTLKYKYLLFIVSAIVFFNALPVRSQTTNKPAVEGWRVHLPFANNHTVCESGSKIYVGSHSGVFTLDESDKSIEILSRVNGLSDVDVKFLAADPLSGKAFIVYDNANIDIIEGNAIYNINSIYSQSMIGDKSINNISFYNNFAYLSCSFGIVVIEIDKKRIADSYTYLGTNGANLPISDVEVYNGNIYASSPSGIYTASLNSFNLNDYHSWSLIKPSAFSSHLAVFRNKLYAIVDSILQTYDGVWTPYSLNIKNPLNVNINHNKLVCVLNSGVITEDQNGTIVNKSINGLQTALLGNDDIIYACGFNTGLMIMNPNGAIDFYNPPGPYGKTASRFAYNINDNTLWVAGGTINGFGTSSGWGNGYNNNKFYRFTDDVWYNYKNTGIPQIETGKDFIDVTVNPKNNHVFLSTIQHGLFEIENVSPLKFTVYDASNSSLGNYNDAVIASGTCIDNIGNLWVSNFGSNSPVSAKTPDGKWYSFKLPSQVDGMATNPYLGFITSDDNNNKWIMPTKGNGIIVYNDHDHPELPLTHEIRILQKDKQKGFLPSNTVFCITKDMKGEMWVGTDQGLCIFSNISNIFKPNADYDAHQLVIKTGLVYSNFLGAGSIYCIRIDAANRKWIGTKNGVWLVSADGYTVIKNFTASNSPLLSDVVYDIGINDKTGEVFFATEKGIISYMGTATAGLETHEDVLVYPNPVRPEYQGLIAIRGLVNDANVKITDVGGNLVYETKANGGMATWNGLNFLGKRAATGVYIIYSTNEDATEQWVGKILFIN